MAGVTGSFIDEAAIAETLRTAGRADAAKVDAVLQKALELKGLELGEVATLLAVETPELRSRIERAAAEVKQIIYGRRLVLFAPLYISNLCRNDCTYCAFRARNTLLRRKALSQEEIAYEVERLVEQGHKRLLLVAGENDPEEGLPYLLKSVQTIYATRKGRGEIRRVNVNVAPLSVEAFRELKGAGIGTYQLFQETYHRATYASVHRGGKKKDYDWRVTVMDRAMEAGIDDVGVGVLFGLYDWRFEVLALLQHVRHLEERFGVGPHTLSVPRIEPAFGSDLATHPGHPVSDEQFRTLVAILRLAVPYTGIIMSTRESAETRRQTFALGVSQISGGSRTNPGGYGEQPHEDEAQFQLGDHRSLDEVVRDVASMGYLPSFCTACYRLGRTGRDFMDLAKPGDIKYHCEPNALSTFEEYLLDYGSAETRAVGARLIEEALASMDPKQQAVSRGLLEQVRAGRRDVFV